MITNFDRYRGYPYWNDPFYYPRTPFILKDRKDYYIFYGLGIVVLIFFAVVIYNMFKKSKTDDLE